VIYGSEFRDNKGINQPRVSGSTPSPTDKDRPDARFALDLGVDFLALSFVRRDADVEALKTLREAGKEAAIVAKIEKPEALDEAEAIVATADAIMVARGDPGVELKRNRSRWPGASL